MWSNARISHYRHPSTDTCTMHMTGVGGRVWVVGGVTHVHGCMGAWVHGVMPYNVHETWVTGGSVGGWGWAWQVGGCHGGRGRGVRVSMLTHATHVPSKQGTWFTRLLGSLGLHWLLDAWFSAQKKPLS